MTADLLPGVILALLVIFGIALFLKPADLRRRI